jgi:hypothetical protein
MLGQHNVQGLDCGTTLAVFATFAVCGWWTHLYPVTLLPAEHMWLDIKVDQALLRLQREGHRLPVQVLRLLRAAGTALACAG